MLLSKKWNTLRYVYINERSIVIISVVFAIISAAISAGIMASLYAALHGKKERF